MGQRDLFDTEMARSLLDELFDESRLYKTGADFKGLLDFVGRMRNFTPFNAMLLQIQKPGLSYAAPAFEWSEKFGRTIKNGARPLLILWPFGPVALVYDVMDTEGASSPEGVLALRLKEKLIRLRWNALPVVYQANISLGTRLMRATSGRGLLR